MSYLTRKLHGHVKVTVYLYAVIKYIFGRYTIGSNFPKLPALLSICLSPVIFLILHVLRIYRLIVHTVLNLKLGSKYYQLLVGTDLIHLLVASKQARPIITTLLYVDYQESEKDFYDVARKEIEMIFSMRKFEKLLCVRKQFMGYYYYEIIETNFDEYFKVIEYGDEDGFNTSLGEVVNLPLPHGDAAMFDVFIGTTQLETGQLPLVFRFHHSVGDAASIFNLFSRELSKNMTINEERTTHATAQLRPLDYKTVANSFVKAFGCVDDPDMSILRGNAQIGQKHLVWFSDKTPEYYQLIRSIKRKVDNVTFVDVVLTAFSASLSKYVKKKTNIFPRVLTTIVAVFQKKIDFTTYGVSDDYELSNKFTAGLLRLPLKVNGDDADGSNLLHRLQLVSKDYDILKNKSLDLEFNRWQATVLLTLLPFSWSQLVVTKSDDSTLVFSNIPGCKRLKLFGSNDVTNFIILDPNVSKAGITLMVTTYDGRLNIALTIDKGIIPDPQDAKDICSNLIEYLNDLDKLT